MKEKINNIYYYYDDIYNEIKILFDLSNKYLYFDSANFSFKNKNEIDIKYKWIAVDYNGIFKNIYINEIKEDELTAYFIKFSNKDIFYIYKSIDGMEKIYQGFEILSLNNPNYQEVFDYMNEEWIEIINL